MLRFVLLCLASFTLLHCDAQNDPDPVLRKKRTVDSRPWMAWPNGVIPYCYDDDLPVWKYPLYEAVMEAYSEHTCITFQKYNDCASILNGGERLMPGGQPYSYVGQQYTLKDIVLSKHPVTIAHELCHVIGCYHEQNSFKLLPVAQIVYENVAEYYQKAFIPMYSRFDDILANVSEMNSPTRYTNYGVSKTGFPVFSKLYPEFLDDVPVIFLDDVSMEINELYSCWANNNCGVQPTCLNEGYPGFAHHQCGCVCPDGLDPATDCATIKPQPSGSWPDCNLMMLKTVDGCPSGFTESTIILHNATGSIVMNTNADPSLDYTVASTEFSLFVCSKTSASNNRFKHGSFAFFSQDITCPEQESGYADFFDANGDLDERLEFCLQEGVLTEPVRGLPTTDSFALLSRSSTECQEIDGFVATLGSIDIDNANSVTLQPDGRLPAYDYSTNFLRLYFCSYKPLSYGGGAVINLDASNPTQVITSISHPAAYPENTEYNWIIMADEGSKLRAEFTYFDVDEHDVFTYRRFNLYSLPTRISSTTLLPGNLVSVENNLAIHFRSGGGGANGITAKGFSITITRLGNEDYCYYLPDKGESYDGDCDFAIDGNKCLPIDRHYSGNFTSSGYADFNGSTSTFLDGSYCRNPQGLLEKPACLTYVNGGNYTLSYCDVCHIEYGIKDVTEHCDAAKAADPTICTGSTGAKCLKNCTLPVVIPPTVGTVNCPIPDSTIIPTGGRTHSTQNATTVKSSYSPGDVIQIDCAWSTKTVKLTCLSSGQWSEWKDPCNGCDPGWAEVQHICYRVVGRVDTWYKAKNYCLQEFGATLMSPRTDEEHNFFLDSRDRLGMSVHWWMGGSYSNGAWTWYADNSPMDICEFGWPFDKAGDKYCAVHNKWQKWMATTCSGSMDRFNFICQKPLIGCRMTCTDRRSDCPAMLDANPEACDDPVVKTNTCTYTCGADVCGITDAQKCSSVPTLANGYMVEIKTSLTPGETVEYMCNSGFVNQGGSLVRACKRGDTLTGTPPICTILASAVTPVYNFPVGDFRFTTSQLTMYTGETTQFDITRDGKIVKWEIYCKCFGTVQMQVWRLQQSMTYKLVGKNTVSCFPELTMEIDIDEVDRISVLAGDRIGLFDITGGCFSYYSCPNQYMPQYDFVHTKTSTVADVITSNDYVFDNVSSCYMFAINAMLGPV